MALYQNEVKCSAVDMEIIFSFSCKQTHFHNKGCARGLILKVRIFGTRKWPNCVPVYFGYFNLFCMLVVIQKYIGDRQYASSPGAGPVLFNLLDS